ncbi:MAG: winged helix-turn-helix domain-containing protein [Rubrivivax sp.]|nr:winged helix-turn-helix domain-containing protein [Rubrivivax sp.]
MNQQSDESAAQRWFVGPWRVDADADEIVGVGRTVKLEPQQMRLLLLLARRAGEVVTTQELLDEVWRDLVVTPNSVYQAVAQLRRQLGDTAAEPTFIQTVHRKGYRLLAPVRRVAWPVPGAAPGDASAPTAGGAAGDAGAPVAAWPGVTVDPATAAVAEPPRTGVPVTAGVTAPVAPGPPAAGRAMPPSRRRLLAGGLAAAAALGIALAWRYRATPAPAAAARSRVAVLPFDDGGATPALAQGLALDIVRALGRRPELDVLGPETALGPPVRDEAQRRVLAQRLQAHYLLQGALVAGTTPRLQVQLVPATADAPVWQREFDSAAEPLSRLPALVAAEAAAALGLPVAADALAATPASQAYELYVLGAHAWRPKTPEAFERARVYFQRGIDLDPAFARNYVGLAWCWIAQGTSGVGLDLPQAIARATPLLERALALEPDAADALTGQAVLHQFAGEFDTARRLLAQALRIQPSYVQAIFILGVVDFDDGWPARAVPQFERVAALEPLGAVGPERLGFAQLFAGEADAAARSFRRALTLEPRYPNGVWGLGVHGYAVGNLVQAVDSYRQALALEPRRAYLWNELAWLYLDLQRPDEAAAAFARARELLPGAGWLQVHAAHAWLAAGHAGTRGAPPPALALDGRQADEGAAFADVCLLRAMAGLPLDAALLQRSLDVAAARGQGWAAAAWFTFQGWHRPLALATVQSLLGQRDAALATLAAVEQRLDALQRQGNRWHMLELSRARALGLRGRPAEALAALERAAAAGARRTWWWRLDPALAEVRSLPRFAPLLAQVDGLLADQRRQLGM